MCQNYTQMTVERLGNDGAEQDLLEFQAACQRVLPAFNGDEEAATDYVWNNGDFAVRLNAGACIYCEKLLEDDAVTVPALDDEDAWASLVSKHEAGCEWVATRAHRVEIETGKRCDVCGSTNIQLSDRGTDATCFNCGAVSSWSAV